MSEKPKQSKSARLVNLLVRRPPKGVPPTKLFNGDGAAWAWIVGDGIPLPVESAAFRKWAASYYFEFCGDTIPSAALRDAIEVIAGLALKNAKAPKQTFLRFARTDRAIYLDLADAENRLVKITRDGWTVEPCKDHEGIPFRRPAGMMALPEPVRGGSVEDLRPFLNVGSEDDFVKAVAFAVGILRGEGPYFVLEVVGEHGSAKTETARFIRRTIDPSRPSTRRLFRKDDDAALAAKNAAVLAFDNISEIRPWQSDILCGIATGDGFATRKFYDQDEEKLYESCRPIILNGIGAIVRRPDLRDRCLTIRTPVISPGKRQEKAAMERRFAEAHPRILGALLDAAAAALREYDSVTLRDLPRMADAARWITAAESALPWGQERFLGIQATEERASAEESVSDSIVGAAVLQLMEDTGGHWHEPPKDTIDRLASIAGQPQKDFPRSPQALYNELDRLAPSLRSVGIEWRRLHIGRDNDKQRGIEIRSRDARPKLRAIQGGRSDDRITAEDLDLL